jgi:hypothetical protein
MLMRGAVGLFFVALLSGCSGGGGVDCSYAACGGDPVGTWNVAGVCTDRTFENPLAENCPESTYSVSLDMNGTIDVRSDGTYSTDTSTVIVSSFSLPSSCLEANQITSCDQIVTALTSDGQQASCSGDADSSCRCTVTNEDPSSATGTWSANGSELTINDGSGADVSTFCVEGSTLKIQFTDSDGNPQLIVLSR